MANPVHKANRNIMKYMAIGAAGLALLGGSYQLFKRRQQKKQKDRVLKILQEIRKELFPIFQRLKKLHDSLKRFLYVHLPEELEKARKSGNAKFSSYCNKILKLIEKGNIEAIQLRVAAKYGMELSELDQLVATVFKDDK